MNGSIAMIGLGVMGANLARNIESRGFKVFVFDKSEEKNQSFKTQYNSSKSNSGNFYCATSLVDLITAMPAPRTCFVLVPAGAPVDYVIEDLIPLLAKDDTIIDGGNTFFKDTQRRERRCQEAGIHFMGIGVSGGEEGALHGPSMMPGGPKEAFDRIEPVLQSICAKVGKDSCVTYIGPDGSGHFVKMVHNGIEYGDMQLIAESYQLLKSLGGFSNEELADIFFKWNKGKLESFLIEITSEIFTKKDDQGDGYLLDKILDKAGQKGTGKWTSQSALDVGVAIPTLAAAVDSRCMSAIKDERIQASKKLASLISAKPVDKNRLVKIVEDSLYAAKIIAYAQGMRMISEFSKEYKWNINLGALASIWRGGCIIRAKFLNEMMKAFDDKSLSNLIMADSMQEALLIGVPCLREVLTLSIASGIPTPAMSASLNYYDQYRSAHLPLNLTQAQRDFFGAHTFERIDKTGSFHAKWQS